MTARGLLDSNVLIAAVAEAHVHHKASAALFEGRGRSFAVSAHSFAEAYAVLTNPAQRSPFRWHAAAAWAALESVAGLTRLVGLTHGQRFEAIRAFAAGGGVGPLLYDRLIGEAAIRNGIDTILTWNVRHMRDLFPSLTVIDPAAFADR